MDPRDFAPDPLTEPFWEAACAGGFVLPFCADCSRAHFYPRPHCPHCGSARLRWRDARRRGTVSAVTVVHRAPAAVFEPDVPYELVMVLLDEGPALLARTKGARTTVGAEVDIGFEEVAAGLPPRIVARPLDGNEVT